MKNLIYSIVLFLGIGSFASLHASVPLIKKELTREIHKTFDVSSGVNLEVENKYGNISIDTWSKNQIQIDVHIKVKSSNTDKAEKFLNEIDVDFNASSSRVSAKTMYPYKNNNSWWSSWFSNGKNLDYEVHYTIQAPSDLSTTIVNKYGNITQASVEGACDITNKYGDIFYKDIGGDLDLTLGYGKASIGTVDGDANVNIKYSTLKMIESKDLEISTKHSNIKIKRCGNVTSYSKYDEYKIESLISLKNDGKHDDFTIGTIDKINIDTKNSDVYIGILNQKGVFDTKYGHVNVKTSEPGVDEILINSKYTDYEFTMGGDFHLNFEGSHTGLHVSNPIEKYKSHKDGKDLSVKAYRRSKEGGAQISAYMRYGDLEID